MNIEAKPLSEFTLRATEILFREMGVIDTIRFLNQFSIGQGDYTKDRDMWIGDMSLEEAVSRVKAARQTL